ncbi:6-phosphogluconate dehydrogenase, decarboxylating [Thermoclostridium stercorarium subsp. stercorarium DSM 8532]|jgi:6-phosphogluconate dehydrogenase|uniref:6-phosphogluconate dehydrogenase, decarboxylating n=3 Tax=Thermoclostridium stercorarium TaxID=1510 RepID=L7VV64_THES1|nr:decarboxylating NADP(+)-dependent phosphogluconate dehydrogenase [Thermoclostridium stercorarium]AGC69483.1 6-phosphogluconate dehydrogenase, decarboxylating [Thermoclostridium stercorarium subsp. stercorarium DSM 8532]AGI40436.1 Gnd [Thermoclostridium stercorarium subsp. stercorarium DSM 8532]ANW99724.1 phosphogluconate dehydrogenase (NADP(+)-dependent, decarboxylating) [Thermoclostridium stercorarium subsp. thermolacticum DSM 2910]ANX02350.1 phosphogluconate dehydrogenase (NADP(+)-dependen
MSKADIGLIGLAVMGENLAMNMESKGFTVAVFNRTTEKVSAFINGRAKGKNIIGTYSIEELVNSLKKPRKIMLMVKAGKPVDDFIEMLIPHLEKGDIIIDGGNSHFPDTIRRTKYLEEKGLLYIGTGVSGGEEGALKGPSLMPGGSPEAWPHVKEIFQAIAAKVDDGTPCCDWVGENGAGHFVKMVHNGIEYGDMQLICEAYHLMKDLLGMTADEMHEVFKEWNEGDLNSYLIEITRDILAYKDEDGQPLVDKILDTAGQKGTGKWTAIAALDEGIPLTLIGEAVFARCLSAMKDERVAASKVLSGPVPKFEGDRKAFIEDIRNALYASKIVSYAQGFTLMRSAAKTYGWNLNYGGIAMMWRGGCIIRSKFLGKIKEAFDRNPDLTNLLLDPFFKEKVEKAQDSWRRVVSVALMNGIPVPAFTSALCYYDAYRCERLPANLLQAQRDYFGAHTYERVDRPRGEFFHTNWTGEGGTTSATTYNV